MVSVAILGFFLHESLLGARSDSQTIGEVVTIASGLAYLRTGRALVDAQEPMLAKAWMALPLFAIGVPLDFSTDAWQRGDAWLAGYELLWESPVGGPTILRLARLPVVACGVALLVAMWLSARFLYGRSAAVVALALGGLAPDLLGSAHLASLEVPLSLAAALALLALLRYLALPTRRRHLALALACGVLSATGLGALPVLMGLFGAVLLRVGVDRELGARGSIAVPRRLARHPRLASTWVGLGGLGCAVVYGEIVAAAVGPGAMGARYTRSIPAYFELVAGRPVELLRDVAGGGTPSLYVHAQVAKLPVITLLVIVVALLSLPWVRSTYGRDEATLLAFVASFLGIAWVMGVTGGPGALLPTLAPVLVFASRVALLPLARGWRWSIVVAMAGGYVGTVAASRPLYLGYSNELARGLGTKPGVVPDANLDRGQDLGRLAEWLRARGNPPVRLAYFGDAPPEQLGIRYQALPAAGPVLAPIAELLKRSEPAFACISANNLQGVFLPGDPYRFLRTREPQAVVGSSIWIYALSRADHAELARVYAAMGWTRWAVHERRLATVPQ